jgi:hypothetical protein
MGGNTYVTCPGTGAPVRRVLATGSDVGPGRPGWDGTGICSECGREVAERGGFAKRHADKRGAHHDGDA